MRLVRGQVQDPLDSLEIHRLHTRIIPRSIGMTERG
jgi:hypothetical protein